VDDDLADVGEAMVETTLQFAGDAMSLLDGGLAIDLAVEADQVMPVAVTDLHLVASGDAAHLLDGLLHRRLHPLPHSGVLIQANDAATLRLDVSDHASGTRDRLADISLQARGQVVGLPQ
jgi:hypothetical protein